MAKAGIQQQYGLFINGEFVPASDGAASVSYTHLTLPTN